MSRFFSREDVAYDQWVDDQIQKARERADWRAGDPRFHQDVCNKLWYVVNPEAYFPGPDQFDGFDRVADLEKRDPGWRRIWKPELWTQYYGHPIESAWSAEQRKRLLDEKNKLYPICLSCRTHRLYNGRCNYCFETWGTTQ